MYDGYCNVISSWILCMCFKKEKQKVVIRQTMYSGCAMHWLACCAWNIIDGFNIFIYLKSNPQLNMNTQQ